jgi:putative membrane protein
MIFVLINGLRLVRQLAVLYGGRPGALGVLRLLRQVMSHLAVTGGVGMADSVVQQVIGHGIASRLSARLGEGMVNGLLTARLGLLTIDLVRPLPFHELPRPALNDLASTLLRPAEAEGSAGSWNARYRAKANNRA